VDKLVDKRGKAVKIGNGLNFGKVLLEVIECEGGTTDADCIETSEERIMSD
jgi:hypothetical protein